MAQRKYLTSSTDSSPVPSLSWIFRRVLCHSFFQLSSRQVLFRERHSPVEIGLIVTAVAALLLGTAVYVLDRNWANSISLGIFVEYQWPRSAMFGALGGFLPALLHAYAISVLIIVALWPWPRTRIMGCLLWFTIASTLELLQSGVGDAWLTSLERPLGDLALVGYLKSYAIHGRFDSLDLLATGGGCLTALAVITAVEQRRRSA